MISASTFGHGSYCISDNGIGFRWGTFFNSPEDDDFCFEKWPKLLPYPLGFIENDKNDEHVIIDFDLNSHSTFVPNPINDDRIDRYFIIGVSAGKSHVVFFTVSGEFQNKFRIFSLHFSHFKK